MLKNTKFPSERFCMKISSIFEKTFSLKQRHHSVIRLVVFDLLQLKAEQSIGHCVQYEMKQSGRIYKEIA